VSEHITRDWASAHATGQAQAMAHAVPVEVALDRGAHRQEAHSWWCATYRGDLGKPGGVTLQGRPDNSMCVPSCPPTSPASYSAAADVWYGADTVQREDGQGQGGVDPREEVSQYGGLECSGCVETRISHFVREVRPRHGKQLAKPALPGRVDGGKRTPRLRSSAR
jgi:hypothetical protein